MGWKLEVRSQILIGSALLLSGVLFGCVENSLEIKGVVLPHHLLVERELEEFYGFVSELDAEEVERVILISPNHFHYGFNYVQSTDGSGEGGSRIPNLDLDTVTFLAESEALYVEPEKFDLEHGVTEHFDFLREYFPEADLLPVTLKQGTPEERLDYLVEELKGLDLSKTLVMASIDFTHHAEEEVAEKNDDRTVEWMRGWANGGGDVELDELRSLAESLPAALDEAVAMDSPESLYVFVRLMEELGEGVRPEFELWKRTSSALMTGLEDPFMNTTHLFMIVR